MERSAETSSGNFLRQRPGIVGLVEEGEDLVAGLEAGDFITDGDDFASAIAAWYGLWVEAHWVFALMVVITWLADGLQADEDLVVDQPLQ
jgi:hypothetical protein